MNSIKKDIKINGKVVDRFLKSYFNKQKYSSLIKPMKYGTLFGGKKIRSSIILNSAKIFNLKNTKVINIANGRNLKLIDFIKRFNLFLFSKIDIIPKYIFIENKDNI